MLNALFEPTITVMGSSFSIATVVTSLLLLLGIGLLANANRYAWLILTGAGALAALHALSGTAAPQLRSGPVGIFLGLVAVVISVYGWWLWQKDSRFTGGNTVSTFSRWLLPTLVGAIALVGIVVLNLIVGNDVTNLFAGIGQALSITALVLFGQRATIGWPFLAAGSLIMSIPNFPVPGPVAVLSVAAEVGLATWGYLRWRRLDAEIGEAAAIRETGTYSVYSDLDPTLVHTHLTESAEQGFPIQMNSQVDRVNIQAQISARPTAATALESVNLAVEWPTLLREDPNPTEECRIALLPRRGEPTVWNAHNATSLREWTTNASADARFNLAATLVDFVYRVHDLDLVVGDMDSHIVSIPTDPNELPLIRFDFSRRMIGSYGPDGTVPRYDLVSDRVGLLSWLKLLLTRPTDDSVVDTSLAGSTASRHYLEVLLQPMEIGGAPTPAEWRYALENTRHQKQISYVE